MSTNELRRKFLLLERLEQAARLLGSVEKWARRRTLTGDESALMNQILYSARLLATSMPPYTGATYITTPSEPGPSTAFLSPETHQWLQDHISDQDVYAIAPRWVWDAVISAHVHSNLYIDRNDRFKRGLGGVIWKQCELCLDPKDRPAWQRVWFNNEKTMKDGE